MDNVKTACFTGIKTERCAKYLGIRFATAERFEYAKLCEYDGTETFDATKHGPACPQYRAYNAHLDNPHRLFYYKEFREGVEFTYDEDCLILDIYAPLEALNCPVMIFFHGGGFDSGACSEGGFDGSQLAEKGIITVFAQYRVGVLGYLTDESVQEKYGRDGNFGLDDQFKAIQWVRNYINLFGGDPHNITLCGQSAGAISIQYLCLSGKSEGLFKRVIMMSGGGMFPRFALPRPADSTRPYWKEFKETAGCKDLEELKTLPLEKLFAALEALKATRNDNIYNTMPVIDGYLIEAPVDKLIKNPLKVGYMIGYTNTDMYAPVMEYIGNKFGKKNGGYIYFFDIDAPGDENGAFHSCDIRYMFGTLEDSWRPYGERDREASDQLSSYVANYAKTGDPNGEGLPEWTPARPFTFAKAMRFAPEKTAEGRAHYLKLLGNMLKKGDPKA